MKNGFNNKDIIKLFRKEDHGFSIPDLFYTEDKKYLYNMQEYNFYSFIGLKLGFKILHFSAEYKKCEKIYTFAFMSINITDKRVNDYLEHHRKSGNITSNFILE